MNNKEEYSIDSSQEALLVDCRSWRWALDHLLGQGKDLLDRQYRSKRWNYVLVSTARLTLLDSNPSQLTSSSEVSSAV